MGDTELESVTSTMSTLGEFAKYDENCRSSRDAVEQLHQWLHQIVEWDKRKIASLIVASAVEAFGAGGAGRLIDAIRRKSHAPGFKE